MSSHPTDWSEEGLICCGLTRGITFSIRHITKMIATKNRIATTGSQLSAQFWISCAIEGSGADTEASGIAWGMRTVWAATAAAVTSRSSWTEVATVCHAAASAAFTSMPISSSQSPSLARLPTLWSQAAPKGRQGPTAIPPSAPNQGQNALGRRRIPQRTRRHARRCARRRHGSGACSPAATGGAGERSRRPRTPGRRYGSGGSR